MKNIKNKTRNIKLKQYIKYNKNLQLLSIKRI